MIAQSGVLHALNPDPYRGVFGADGEKYAKDVQDLIDYATSGHVAAFVSEAIQVITYSFRSVASVLLLKASDWIENSDGESRGRVWEES